MLFDPAESIDLNGNTGPFIQYTHARICSLLKKAGAFDSTIAMNHTLLSQEKELIKTLLRFPQAIADASEAYSPAVLANYCYELVKVYNYFYQNVLS